MSYLLTHNRPHNQYLGINWCLKLSNRLSLLNDFYQLNRTSGSSCTKSESIGRAQQVSCAHKRQHKPDLSGAIISSELVSVKSAPQKNERFIHC